jgi:hypothetical protein
MWENLPEYPEKIRIGKKEWLHISPINTGLSAY